MTATATRPSTQEPADRFRAHGRLALDCRNSRAHSPTRNRNRRNHPACRPGNFSARPRGKSRRPGMHRESYEISPATAQSINKAKSEHRRVVAVGTTTVRTLEHSAAQSDAHRSRVASALIAPGRGEADAFIYPGYRFRVVDALLTNFHLPQSTLLMLVCALGGPRQVLQASRRRQRRLPVLFLRRLHVRGVRAVRTSS